ncbi:MAG TPA: hypothetical protein VLG50_04625 [Candidatus Saccharimonadales bacterium]|nr:hypothetical protein [Candidatus Saccharimonadales bacterium]
MKHSLYFQAHVKKEFCWIVSSTLKFTEYVAFDRTIDKDKSIFEFFVAADLLDVFLDVMDKLEQEGIIFNMQQLPNRFIQGC